MADSVAVKTIVASKEKSIFLLTNKSDGTGEVGVTKIDISALPGAPARVKVTRMEWAVEGMRAELYFDRTAADRIFLCSGSGQLSLEEIPDQGTGGTGDIKVSTVGAAANAVYSIMVEVKAVE
jgi:hypothetical protein